MMNVQVEPNYNQIDMKIHREKCKLEPKLKEIQMKQVSKPNSHKENNIMKKAGKEQRKNKFLTLKD